VSGTTPWDQYESERDTQEILADLREEAERAKSEAAKRRWLVTLRAADGAERHLSMVGTPPRELVLPLRFRVTFDPNPTLEHLPTLERRYQVRDMNFRDGTAVYHEEGT